MHLWGAKQINVDKSVFSFRLGVQKWCTPWLWCQFTQNISTFGMVIPAPTSWQNVVHVHWESMVMCRYPLLESLGLKWESLFSIWINVRKWWESLNWLVLPPLWKRMELKSVGTMKFPILMESHNPAMFQTTNQLRIHFLGCHIFIQTQ